MSKLVLLVPNPQFEWLSKKKFGVKRKRACPCGYSWWTVELPIYKQWKFGAANCCTWHTSQVGKLIDTVTPRKVDRRIEKGETNGQGPSFARSMGGIYRRYRCSKKGCVDPKVKKRRHSERRASGGVFDEWSARRRWSTVEVMAAGLRVFDATLCPKCKKDRGRIQPGTTAPVESAAGPSPPPP